MARKYPDLIGDLAIIQGETYRQLTHTLPGDKTTWTARGQIRTKLLADDAGDPLAVFDWEDPVYDAEADETTFYPYLTAAVTTNLIRTSYQGKAEDLKVKKAYVYDFEFESPDGEVKKLAPGFVQVIGEVTDNSQVYDPPVFWDGGIDEIELTNTTGLIKTYTIWGDAAKTINLGTFAVSDGNGIASTGYNSSTGILTITFTDNTTFATGDLRADLDAAEIKSRYESNLDTNAYTDAEKTKLAGLNAEDYTSSEEGDLAVSAVQPSALVPIVDAIDTLESTKAPLANPVFTGTGLILPNNSRINGVEHFYQPTKPTARGDGSALVIGDRWWKTDDGTEWFWNGTYWLGREQLIGFGTNFNGLTPSGSASPIPGNPGGILMTKVTYVAGLNKLGSVVDNDNYLIIRPVCEITFSSTGTSIILPTISTQNALALFGSSVARISVPVNIAKINNEVPFMLYCAPSIVIGNVTETSHPRITLHCRFIHE